MSIELYNADCIEFIENITRELCRFNCYRPTPYGLNFMGKEWDKLGSTEGLSQQKWHEAWTKEAYRVLKPGGFFIGLWWK